jgi:hypothetical protein
MGEQTMATKNQLVMQLDSNLTPFAADMLRNSIASPQPASSEIRQVEHPGIAIPG